MFLYFIFVNIFLKLYRYRFTRKKEKRITPLLGFTVHTLWRVKALESKPLFPTSSGCCCCGQVWFEWQMTPMQTQQLMIPWSRSSSKRSMRAFWGQDHTEGGVLMSEIQRDILIPFLQLYDACSNSWLMIWHVPHIKDMCLSNVFMYLWLRITFILKFWLYFNKCPPKTLLTVSSSNKMCTTTAMSFVHHATTFSFF